ncbi:MAG: FAD-dependent monooxygenase [Acidimicrobiales bacterium]
MTTTAAPDHTVVIVGGGPTGLMLAAELALAGVDVAIVERRADQTLRPQPGRWPARPHPRGARPARRGPAVPRRKASATRPSASPTTSSTSPARRAATTCCWPWPSPTSSASSPAGSTSWRAHPAPPRGRRAHQDDDGVDVALADGTTMRAAWLVGCDGGRSLVRKAAGIAFVGLDPSTSWIIAEVELDDPVLGVRPEGGGIGPATPGPATAASAWWCASTRSATSTSRRSTSCAALDATYGSDFGARAPTRLARFSDVSRQAAAYRAGRVLLAGDAAHVHPPQGGQGLNLGVQDAVNLGWKLALVAQGAADDDLLDTYHDERHPVGARVLDLTSAQVALATPDERHAALQATVAELLAMDEPRRRLAAQLAGLDVRYDLGDAHPLLGRRMPDLDLALTDGTTVAPSSCSTRPAPCWCASTRRRRPRADDTTVEPWRHRLRVVDATADAIWDLPVIGSVDAPAAVLIRPDGHVAWTAAADEEPLDVVLTRWCGAQPRT